MERLRRRISVMLTGPGRRWVRAIEVMPVPLVAGVTKGSRVAITVAAVG